jgi:hypothetical protein
MPHLPHIKDGNGHWNVTVSNMPIVFDPTHPEYTALVECVRTGNEGEFIRLIETGHTIENWSEGDFQFIDGFLFYDDEPVRKVITNRIVQMLKENWDHKPMLKFLENLYENVSNRAVNEFYDWIQHKGLAITPDGCILGYKGVVVYEGVNQDDLNGNPLTNGDLVDKYTGNSYRNNVGDEVTMKRRKVDDNCNNGCGTGLHAGTFEYASSWAGDGGKVVLVKIDPRDVVSIPVDCDFQKLRCSKYTVVDVAREIIETAVVDDYYDDDYSDDYDDDYELEDGDVINDSW